MQKKLFIPGPVQVGERSLAEMGKQMIYHRSEECKDIIRKIKTLFAELLQTDSEVFLVTSSATGAMEAAVRSCVQQRVLCLANGEFGRRWHEIATANGKEAKLLDFGDGKHFDIRMIEEELRKDYYEAVTLIINDTPRTKVRGIFR